MGRYLLLLIAGCAIAGAGVSLTRSETQVRQTTRLSQSADESLARQAALSGFAVAERAALAGAADWTETGVPLAGGDLGTYDAAATTSGGTTTLSVMGHYGGAAHTIHATYESGIGIPAAVIAHAANVDTGGDPAFSITGAVTRPPSVSSSGWDASAYEPVGGVASATAALDAAIQADFGGRIGRISGSPAFRVEPAPDWVQRLVDEAPTLSGATIKTTGRYRLVERRVGSPSAPAVVVAHEGALLEDGARGYGILIVTGDFRMIDDARWEGIVIVRDTPGVETTVHIEDDARIFGTLVMHGVDEGGGSAPVGDFNFRILDTAAVKWSGEPIERLDGIATALDPVYARQRRFHSVAP